MKQILLKKNVLNNNNEIAEKLNNSFNEQGTLAINLLGSPGAGKTSVLEKIIAGLKESGSLAVIEGDLYTAKDAERIEAQQVPVVQVNTGGGCHLDAKMIDNALEHLDREALDLLVVENVGNLVCPASYNLGEHLRVTILSVTEGNDKPMKYPAMFQKSDLIVINKIDLLPYIDFSVEEARKDLLSLNDKLDVIEVSCTTGEGLDHLTQYLTNAMKKQGELCA